MAPESILKTYFGYQKFRPGQSEVVNAILAGRDCLALLPTGGGKSICFQVPGLLLPGTTVVVSPLISLMKDQVDTLKKRGIAAEFLNSSLTQTETWQSLKKLASGQLKFIYLAPERLQQPEFLTSCRQTQVSLVVVDEAHCLSEWGDDFRPAYLKILDFVQSLPVKPSVAAFTATATQLTQTDIIARLGLVQPVICRQSFFRSNLRLNVQICPLPVMKELSLIRLLLSYQGQAGIIYTGTRRSTEILRSWLDNFHIFHGKVAAYHGGQTAEKRARVQEAFLTDQLRIIVATNAFGMGVDKPNVRWVIHYYPPPSLENYYQEVGRGGRDGQPATGHLLYCPTDKKVVADLVLQGVADRQRRQVLHRKLTTVLNFIHFHKCRSQMILKYFGETGDPCGQCDICRPQPKNENHDQPLFKTLMIRWQQVIQQQPLLFPSHQVPVATLKWLALLQPQTEAACLTIPGIGQGWLTVYWPFFKDLLAPPDKLTTSQPDWPGLGPPRRLVLFDD